MEKKVEDILEAFENHRFQDALRQIDQLVKKVGKDTKKKNALTENDNRILQLVKCGSLANIGKVHEANQIMETYFTQKVLSEVPDKQKFMFVSIAEMAYDEKIPNKIQVLNKYSKDNVRFQRFMLSERLFSAVSKSFLKEYATQKREEDGLAQIFLEYINEINKVEPIENYFSRDLLIQFNKKLNLKMVELFFTKYFLSINLGKLENQKLRASIIDLRIRLAIHAGKTEQAKKFYLEHFEYIQENFVYLRSIRQMPQNQVDNHKFYIENCGVIFRRNLEIEKYVPIYDYYDEFLDFVLSQNITKDFVGIQTDLLKESELPEDQLYSFKQIPNDKILIHYYQSLSQELKSLTLGQKHALAKKSDYYKISIKGLMLQLLKILYSVALKSSSPQQVHKILSEIKPFIQILEMYFLEFSKTFTYPNEMVRYFPFLKEKFEKVLEQVTTEKLKHNLPSNFDKPDDNLILLTNAVKLLVVLNKQKLLEWKQIQRWVKMCWGFYQQFIEEVQQMKRRQKGEIFLSDQFIIIISDLISHHIENFSSYESIQTQFFIESALVKLMAILDYATELSPFNGYLKLRLIYVCQKLNYFDKLYDTYISLDIKSVQFETLGYFLTNPLISFHLFSQCEQKLIRMVCSYRENHRETSEYCLKGLKAGTTHQVFEYFSYQKRLQLSFSKMNLFYTLYLKYQKKQHSEFYLDWILKKLNLYKAPQKKINFNCDTKTMQNFILNLDSSQINCSELCPYNEYHGYLNSPQVFELEISLRKLESLFRSVLETKSDETQKLIDTLLPETEIKFLTVSKTASITDLYDIEKNFFIINDYLSRRVSCLGSSISKVETFSLSKIKKEFLFYLKASELKITFFKSFIQVLTLLKQTENNEALVNQANKKFKAVFEQIENFSSYLNESMLWREQVKACWLFRQTLFTENHLVRMMNEEAGKLKKLPKGIKNSILQFSGNLQKIVLGSVTAIKFSDSLKVDSQVLNLNIDNKYVQKVQQRDEMLRRLSSMDQKQAKDYLLR